MAFWLCLFAAAGLYALVVLAPKLAEREQLRANYREFRGELVAQESRLLRLQQVSLALKTDPQFADELARLHLRAKAPGEELIPVEGALALSQPLDADTPTTRRRDVPAWYAPAVMALAGNPDARGVVLLAAVVLVLFAFAFLNESPADQSRDRTHSDESLLAQLFGRYRRPEHASPPKVRPRRMGLLDPEDDPETWGG